MARIAAALMAFCLLLSEAGYAQNSTRSRTNERAGEEKTERRTDTRANEVSELIEKLDYPELMVVPRASERLRMEAREEASSWYYTHWQIELAGAATLYNSMVASSNFRSKLSESEKNQADSAVMIGRFVGGGWIAAGVLLGLRRPYREGLANISKYDGKDGRSAVMRERLAEEALEAPARIMRPIQWFSALTNFGANVAMGVFQSDEGRLTAGVAAIVSFMPLMFEDHRVRVYEKHLEYKSKIYGPLTSVSPMYDSSTNRFVPSVGLTWVF